jgi:diguanylate cyclase (GGDEF)-like protein/PAS domain S-box-containing protein
MSTDVVEEHPTLDGQGRDGVWSLAEMETLAREWTSAALETSCVPMTWDQAEQCLLQLTGRLMDMLLREPFTVGPAANIGADLVAAKFTGQDMLSRTLQLLGNSLLKPSGHVRERLKRAGLPQGNELATRVVALLAALADGYAEALREQVFEQQGNLNQAVIEAMEATTSRALQASEMRFHTVFSSSAVGIVIADIEGHILEMNYALRDILGYKTEDLRHRSMEDLVHADDLPPLLVYCQEMAEGNLDQFRAHPRLLRVDGEPVWTYVVVSLVRGAEGEPAYQLGMVENVSDLYLLQQRLQHQTLHDSLTGLPNRTLFMSRLESTLGRSGPTSRVALIDLDIDGFKMINDGLGYEIGDKLLRAFAGRLQSAVPAVDGSITSRGDTTSETLVARIGGDEFAILVDGSAGALNATAMVEQMLTELNEPFHIDGHVLSVSASAGIVERPRGDTSPTELMRRATITLHWAKEDGKAQWALFDADRNVRDRARFALAAAMPFALETGEFYLEYEPLVRLRDGAVIGAEALLRWDHPDLGELPYEEFIELAEKTGFAVPLGHWVLRSACGSASQWQQQFGEAAPFVSVSLAPRQSGDPDLIRDVQTILRETGLNPNQLQLQLDVRTVDSGHGDMWESLRVLADMGVRIVLDGFGSGYADIGQLRNLPVSGLKISGSLVAGLAGGEHPDPVDQHILSNLVSTAHLLKLITITDGVETAAQAAQLNEMGSDVGKGQFFARSGPPENIQP